MNTAVADYTDYVAPDIHDFARLMRSMYLALMDAGFTAAEALTIVTAVGPDTRQATRYRQ